MNGRSPTHPRAAGPALLRPLLAVLTLAACRPAPKDRIALVGATLIDGTGGPAQPNSVIVVKGTRIDTVAARDAFTIPKTARVVDVSGKYIIPGLIDAHVHLARWTLPRYLAYGVTTVRELHANQDSAMVLREQVARGEVAGPRIFSAGAMLDGDPPTYPDATPVKNEDDARRAVDSRVVAPVDVIKVYTRITPALLRAVVDEAAVFHVKVAAHLGLTDALTAGKLGVTSIEHLSGVPEATLRDPAALYAAHRQGFFPGWNAFERSWAGLDSAALSRVALTLADAHVIMVPTLVLHETLSRMDDPALLSDPGLKVVPDSEIARWNVPDLRRRAGWTDADFAAFRQSRPLQDLFLREFRGAGGTIAAGTDAANQLLVPGLSEHTELELLVNAGLTPADAILSATRNGARLLGADSLGQLLPGAAADLVVLGGDPLADIRNTRQIERVMARGVLLSPDSIRAHW